MAFQGKFDIHFFYLRLFFYEINEEYRYFRFIFFLSKHSYVSLIFIHKNESD